MNIISTSEPKARKEHCCDWCGEIIEVGEIYDCSFNECCGDVYTWKNHKRCMSIMHHFNAFDECEEGVTQDDFIDIINDAYFDLVPDHKSFKDIPSFKFRLDFVCNKHLK